VMHMIKNKQVYQEVKSIPNKIRFIHQLFGIAS
ncbi:IS6 family transposase, partial [Priestia megaterium]|nr:IS6 family transposase [Priestia megaterium]